MPDLLAISACLLGRACRYDGASRPAEVVKHAVARWREGGGAVVAVCPEELGDLGTPRPGAQLVGGDGHAVLDGEAAVRRTADGGDVTGAFLAGAMEAGRRCEGASAAVLKARSPSCGCGQTSIDGAFRSGDGVFAALLRRRGVPVMTDEDTAAIFRLVQPFDGERSRSG